MDKDTKFDGWVEHCLNTKCKNCKYDTYAIGKGCFRSYCEENSTDEKEK